MTFIKNPKDFWSGILYIAFGVFAILIALNYPVGTAGRMGPGYFPRALGILLILLGAVLSLRALRLRGSPIAFPTFKPLFIIIGSVVLFGVVAGPLKLGLVVATVVLIVTSSMASDEFTWKAALVSSVALAAFTVLAFAYGLQLQLPVWPAFLVK
ncbi:MAG: tripartite tricarboxylate transporter TctB family protein [Burkholderiales bacterium]|nr:tripartite tricarboxylate transporter TctB family protein [Burkholderiales bacterium]